MSILSEAFTVAFVTAIIGLIVSYLIMRYTNTSPNFKFDHWDEVLITFFITGFFVRVAYEVLPFLNY